MSTEPRADPSRGEGSLLPVLMDRLREDLRTGSVPAARVADLAQAAGVSIRTLYRASARHLGGPPMSRLRLSRLRQARERLLEAAPGETVTSVATEWGFFHLGRFSGLYRRQFGESPSETLRRARTLQKMGWEVARPTSLPGSPEAAVRA